MLSGVNYILCVDDEGPGKISKDKELSVALISTFGN